MGQSGSGVAPVLPSAVSVSVMADVAADREIAMELDDVKDLLDDGKPDEARAALVLVMIARLATRQTEFTDLLFASYTLGIVATQEHDKMQVQYNNLTTRWP